MAQFLVLARDSGESRREMSRMSPEEMQRIMGKYMAWAARLREAGHLQNSNKLRDDEGRVLRRPGGKLAITDGPFVEIERSARRLLADRGRGLCRRPRVAQGPSAY